ncbi:CRACD-like protein isoform X2 [Solea solea]|uniref:CRACD-like protein isoform X2 n=1 Tax=Solea solea TaxID=90069 RepID=UPI00272B0218|nr:CRACD-like protein isoform X2 [Solea solea]
MESSSGDVGGSTEDVPGSKKTKLKSLRTRLFKKSGRTGEERHDKLSQSASDITAGEELGSDDDLACSHSVMGSRALSHDSIFLDDEVLTDTEPARVLSQENVHSKIKALQTKLQQQKMHLGPPPLVLPVRRPEDVGSHLEDDGLLSGSPKITGSDVTSQGVFSKNTTRPSSPPLSPVPVPALAKYVAPYPSRPIPASAPSVTETALDLSSPAQFTPCLDTSAARHRMSVKPRNQRASTKKRVATTDSRLSSYTPNNSDHSESVNEEELPLCVQDKVSLETDQGEADIINTAQRAPSKTPEVEPVASEASAKSSSLTLSQPEPAPPSRAPPVSSHVLRLKPQRPVGVTSSERPHSSFIESELKSRREAGFEIQVMSYERRNTLKRTEDSSEKLSAVASSTVTFRPSAVPQEVQDETETTKGLKRPAPGSGSFHFSITAARERDEAIPRSNSFVGIREQAEATHEGREDKSSSSQREKEELRDLQPRGSPFPFAVGRLRQEGAPPKSSVLQWDKRGSLTKSETSSASKNAAADTGGSVEVEKSQREVKRKLEEGERSHKEVKRNQEEVERSLKEVKRSREEVEEAVEAQEDVQEEEGKMAFGVKLRTTSQSRRFQRDSATNHLTKPPLCEDYCGTQNKQEVSVSSSPSTSADVRVTDPAPSGFSLPVKNNLPSTGESHVRPAEVRATASDHRDAETVLAPQPQTASSEVSWMSLALEKTRSLQQLFTSRFPRDKSGATQPEAQPTNQTEPQTSASPPSTDSVKSPTVKPSQVSVHQKTSVMSPALSKAFTDAQTSPSHPHDQTKSWTAQSSLRSCTQTESSSPLAQGSATHCLAQSQPSLGQHATPSQQPPWSNRVLQQTIQPRSTTVVSSTSSATAAPPGGQKEGSVQEKEASSSSDRRAVRGGSVSMRAAFLERRAERTSPTVTKEVDLKKVQTEAQTLDESPASAKATPVSTDTKPEGRQGLKAAESTPTERPREDKWIRRNVATSSPSSSPTQSTTVLQSMSGHGQPSWMELAKRKSMAWSDKTMD